jgi:hypothetical protein
MPMGEPAAAGMAQPAALLQHVTVLKRAAPWRTPCVLEISAVKASLLLISTWNAMLVLCCCL